MTPCVRQPVVFKVLLHRTSEKCSHGGAVIIKTHVEWKTHLYKEYLYFSWLSVYKWENTISERSLWSRNSFCVPLLVVIKMELSTIINNIWQDLERSVPMTDSEDMLPRCGVCLCPWDRSEELFLLYSLMILVILNIVLTIIIIIMDASSDVRVETR